MQEPDEKLFFELRLVEREAAEVNVGAEEVAFRGDSSPFLAVTPH